MATYHRHGMPGIGCQGGLNDISALLDYIT